MTAAAPDIEVEIPVGEVDLAATLRAAAILPRDPTVVLRPTAFARATITPDGPGTLSISWGSSTDTAGVSAVPMAARVVNKVGQDYDRSNLLLMHAMGEGLLTHIARRMGVTFDELLDTPDRLQAMSDDEVLAVVREVTALFEEGAGGAR